LQNNFETSLVKRP